MMNPHKTEEDLFHHHDLGPTDIIVQSQPSNHHHNHNHHNPEDDPAFSLPEFVLFRSSTSGDSPGHSSDEQDDASHPRAGIPQISASSNPRVSSEGTEEAFISPEPHISSQFYTFNADSHSLMIRCLREGRHATPAEIRLATPRSVLKSWRSVWKDRNEDTAYLTAWKRIQDKLTARLDPAPPVTSPRCFASTANSDLLRSQLDRLHVEAESTRAKANSNRLRLLRLSEAAENLRKQAAVNVQTGKVNDARELLLQKKKVVQALDKAKARIELLDTLSSKLNEAISVKETQLIGNISLDPELDRDKTSGGVHIVSPKLDSSEDEQENDPLGLDSQDSQLIEEETLDTDNHLLEDASTGIDFREVSSYESFLGNVDQKLGRIEAELVTVVNVASLVLNHEDKPKNLKVQQTAEILEEIRSVRERIANIICKESANTS